MSKNAAFIPSFRFKIAVRLALVLLCVSSSLVFSDISWGKKPTREEIRNLIEKLNTNDEWDRDKTIEKLKKIGEDAVPFLVKVALDDESLFMRIGVKEVLIDSDYEIAGNELIIALEDTDIRTRRRAIKWFSEWLSKRSWNIKSKYLYIVPKLTKLLDDKNSSVRSSAAYALWSMGEKIAPDDEVITALTKRLNDDKDNSVRSNAAGALGSMGEKAATDDEVITALTKRLNDDKDDLVRSNAAGALWSMGETAATNEVITALTKRLNDDKDDLVRSNAAGALGSMGKKAATDDEVITALTKLLNHKDDSVRRNAAGALGSMGEKAA
ncbi:MAG: HEAT repeat domain-containing protein, partial [Cyanobacteria bacterium P01_D01_bin.50]